MITAMLIVVPFLLITLLGARFLIISLRQQRLTEVSQRLSGQHILLLDSSTNFMGQESLGVGAVHGNGVLALTRSQLYFLMWLPKREIKVLAQLHCR